MRFRRYRGAAFCLKLGGFLGIPILSRGTIGRRPTRILSAGQGLSFQARWLAKKPLRLLVQRKTYATKSWIALAAGNMRGLPRFVAANGHGSHDGFGRLRLARPKGVGADRDGGAGIGGRRNHATVSQRSSSIAAAWCPRFDPRLPYRASMASRQAFFRFPRGRPEEKRQSRTRGEAAAVPGRCRGYENPSCPRRIAALNRSSNAPAASILFRNKPASA